MKIAIFDSFPNNSFTAEKEFIIRSINTLRKMEHIALCVTTSDEIICFNPDIVIITHEYIPKLTDHYTIGLLWSPIQGYINSEERIKSIRSWDLIFPINNTIRQFAIDTHYPLRHNNSISDFNFLPSAPIIDVPIPKASTLSLAYVGAHWEGNRHDELLYELSKIIDLNIYGPPNTWKHMPKQYRGSLPFDGESIIKTLNKHGAVLAIHKLTHVNEGTPSMRVFEACAAKCLIFTEPILQLMEIFGKNLQYLNMQDDSKTIAASIKNTLNYFNSSQELFNEMVNKNDLIFKSKVCLEHCYLELLNDVRQHINTRFINTVNETIKYNITVIIRCGSRPLSMLKRSVKSIQNQTYKQIGLLFIRYAEIDGFNDWINELKSINSFLFIKEIFIESNGIRSIAMWTGLHNIQTELFSLLDDDDELFSNHFYDLVTILKNDNSIDLVYSGAICQEEDGIYFNNHYRFKGEINKQILERRMLKFFQDYDLDKLIREGNYILSHSWLARSRILTIDILNDPKLEVAEDMYLIFIIASRFKIKFSGIVSVLWNLRSIASGNSMTSVKLKIWEDCCDRLKRRLEHIEFPVLFLGKDIFPNGFRGNLLNNITILKDQKTELNKNNSFKEKIKNHIIIRKTEFFWRPILKTIRSL